MGPSANVLTMKTVALICACWVVGSWSAHVGWKGNDLSENALKSRSRFPEEGSQLTYEEEDAILTKLMPFVTFQCAGRQPGFYADRQFNCEVFHLCQSNGEMATRMCPPKSRFNQDAGICDDEVMVKCRKDDDVIELATDGSWGGHNLRDQIPPTSTSFPETATEPTAKRVARQVIYTHRLIPRQTSFTQRQGPIGPPIAHHNNFLVPLVPQQSTNGPLFILPQTQFFRFNLPADVSQFAPLPAGAQQQRAVQLQVPTNVLSNVGVPVNHQINTLAQPVASSSNSNRLQVEPQQSLLRQGQLLVQQQPGNHQIPNRGPTSQHNRQGFQQQPPHNSRPQFDQEFFIDDGRIHNTDPRGQFFGPAPQRFHAQQDNRPPQNGNNHPRNNGNQQPQGPPPSFFGGGGPLPPFSGGPPFDEEDFFRPNFPHGGPPSDIPQRHQPQRPQVNGPPARPQQISTNFIIRPEDNAIINGLQFPGPPQGQRAPPPSSQNGPSQNNQNQASHSSSIGQQRPNVQQQRPHSPQVPFQNRPSQNHNGAASFPSRFPPQSNNGFNISPPDRFQDPFHQGLPEGFHQPPLQFPFAANPPRRPSQGITSQPHHPTTTTSQPRPPTTTRSPTTRAPVTQHIEEDTVTPSSGLRRPTDRPLGSISNSGNRFISQEDREPPRPQSLPAPSPRPTQTSTFNSNNRGTNRFHLNEDDGSEFNRPDHTRPTPTRRPAQASFDPSPLSIPSPSFGSDSAEAFGIPPPSNDFGTKLGPDGVGHDGMQHFDAPTERNPPSTSPASRRPTSQRPNPSEQFFSASPSRTAAGSSPFHPEDMFSHFIPPPSRQPSRQPSRPLPSSTEEFLPPTSQRSPLHSTTEGNLRKNKRPGFGPQHQNDHSTEQFDTSTEFPDFFSSSQPGFPELDGNRNRFNLQDTRRPSQDFPEDLFSLPPPEETNFPTPGLQNGPFRGSFHPQHDTSANHNNIPKEIGVSNNNRRPPGSEQNFNSFQQSPHQRPNDDNRGSQFNQFEPFDNNGRFPDGPTFGPQSNDQLAPPELPPFTARPPASSFNDNQESPISQNKPTHDSTQEKPSTDAGIKQQTIEETVTVSPTEITSTINEVPSSTKRGRRPVGVTNAGRNGVRSRQPQRVRTRTRRPSTESSGHVTDPTLIGEASTPAPPRRRFRPTTSSSSAERISTSSSTIAPRRRVPVPQKNSIRKNTGGTTPSTLTSSKDFSGELSSQEPTSGESATFSANGKRRPGAAVGNRVAAGRKGNSTRMVVRRRRPVTSSSSPSPHTISGNDISSGTVDHSARFGSDSAFSSSNGRKNVAVVSRFDSIEDSAISASQEQVIVTKAHAVSDSVSANDGGIQDHSSSLVTQPEKFDTEPTAASLTSRTFLPSTASVIAEEFSVPSTVSINDVNEENHSTKTEFTTETTTAPTTTTESTTEEIHSTVESSTTKKMDDKPEALSKLRSLLSRKFVIKLTTDAPQKR